MTTQRKMIPNYCPYAPAIVYLPTFGSFSKYAPERSWHDTKLAFSFWVSRVQVQIQPRIFHVLYIGMICIQYIYIYIYIYMQLTDMIWYDSNIPWFQSWFVAHMLHGAGIFTYIWVMIWANVTINIPAPWSIWVVEWCFHTSFHSNLWWSNITMENHHC